jgi:hypothetical protein
MHGMPSWHSASSSQAFQHDDQHDDAATRCSVYRTLKNSMHSSFKPKFGYVLQLS